MEKEKQIVRTYKEIREDYLFDPSIFSQEDDRVAALKWIIQERLTQVCLDLAKMMVKDGEGGTKLVRVQVEGGATEEEALNVARHVATSTLLKAAFFGADPNWGRVVAAVGSSG